MEGELQFDDLDYGLARDSAILPDDHEHMDDRNSSAENNEVPLESPGDPTENLNDYSMDAETVRHLLREACMETGVTMTPELVNFALAASASLSVTSDSMRWLTLAISYTNNQKILPNMANMVEELRAEIKTVQSVNSSLKLTSTDIVKKITSVKDEIFSGFESLKQNVLSKLIAVEKSSHITPPTAEQLRPSTSGTKPGDNKKTKEGLSVVNVHKGSTPGKSSNSKKEWVPKENTAASSVTSVPATPEPKLRSIKLKFLKSVDADMSVMKALPDSIIDQLITDEEMSIIATSKNSEEVAELMDEVEVRLALLEQEMS